MDQLILASLSHTHYWYEVGMLKVPASINTRDTDILHSITVISQMYLINRIYLTVDEGKEWLNPSSEKNEGNVFAAYDPT